MEFIKFIMEEIMGVEQVFMSIEIYFINFCKIILYELIINYFSILSNCSDSLDVIIWIAI